MDDNSIIQFGKHKGEKMANVPDSWLLWFWNAKEFLYRKNPGCLRYEEFEVMEYIKDFGPENLK